MYPFAIGVAHREQLARAERPLPEDQLNFVARSGPFETDLSYRPLDGSAFASVLKEALEAFPVGLREILLDHRMHDDPANPAGLQSVHLAGQPIQGIASLDLRNERARDLECGFEPCHTRGLIGPDER